MRDTLLAALAALAATALASCWCQSSPPPTRRSDARPPVKDAAVPVEPELPEAGDATRQRPVTTVAIAVDHSLSMAGFAGKGAIAPLVDAMGGVLRKRDVASNRVQFLSVGAEIKPVSEQQVVERGRFSSERADLVAALGAPELDSADLAVIVTDGQPSSPQIFTTPCSQLSTEDITGLAPKLGAALAAHRGLWLILERTEFAGTFYLNCHTPTSEIRDWVHEHGGSCRASGECRYPHSGERTALLLVSASPEVIDGAAEIVAGYLAQRPHAKAIRLHATPADRWKASEPVVEVVGERAPAAVRMEGSAGAWRASAHCATRDAGVRICLKARAPVPDPSIALAGMSGPRTVLSPGAPDELYESPAGAAFDVHQLSAMQAWNYDRCGPVWQRYRQLAREARTPVTPTCVAGQGEIAAEFAIACGCLHPGARETIGLVQEPAIDDKLASRVIEWGYAADEKWYAEPERIRGLSDLLEKLARSWSAKLTSTVAAATIVRLELTITPANSPAR